jgi:glycosyltransferase involved in cell wall biosynthesis
MSERLLMCAYIFPPLAGAGVYRTLKFVKYLPSCGVEPVVLSADDPDWYMTDTNGVLAGDIPAGIEVHRVKSRRTLIVIRAACATALKAVRLLRPAPSAEASGPAGEALGTPSGPSLRLRILQRHSVPDEQVGWTEPATAEGLRIVKAAPGVDCLYASGPPFSALVVGARLKERTGLPFVVDFRDAWTGNPVLMKGLSQWALARNFEIEARVIEAADVLIGVAPGIIDYYRATYPGHAHKLRLLTNGYDPDDFCGIESVPPSDRLVFSHVGELSSTRDPSTLLTALASVKKANPDTNVRMQFVGYRDPRLAVGMDRQIAKLGLESVVRCQGPMPHDEAIRVMRSSHVLVFQSAFKSDDPVLGRTYPGKIFEYMAAGRPILAIVPEGPSAELVLQSGCGWRVDPSDTRAATRVLNEIVHSWKSTGTLPACHPELERYERRSIARELASIVAELVQPAANKERSL